MNCLQLLLRSKTRYFSRGSIIADSRENARGLIVITAGQVHSAFFVCQYSFKIFEYALSKVSSIWYVTYPVKIYCMLLCRWEQRFLWTQTMLMMQTKKMMAGLCSMCSSAGDPQKKFPHKNIHYWHRFINQQESNDFVDQVQWQGFGNDQGKE